MNWENEFENSTGLSVYTVDEKHEECYCQEYVDWLIAKLNKPVVDFKEPLCLRVKYDLSADFVMKVNSEKGCSIKNVFEITSCQLLEYWIDCPKDKENLITDFAFMTWIKNPVFQKYYSNSKAFEKISDKYISEREQEEKKNSELTTELINENRKLRKSLILGLYHDGWADKDGNPRPIHNNLGAPDWVKSGFEALSNSR